MLSVRIWNLQSDSDATVVKSLEKEFLRFRQFGDIAIRKTGVHQNLSTYHYHRTENQEFNAPY